MEPRGMAQSAKCPESYRNWVVSPDPVFKIKKARKASWYVIVIPVMRKWKQENSWH